MTKLALLLAVLANGLAGYLFFTRGGERGPATVAAASGNADVDALARRTQEEVRKVVAAHDERFQSDMERRLRELEALRAQWTEAVQKAQKSAEGSAHYNTGKIEEIDQQVNTTWANVEKQSQSVETLAARVKALESRPVTPAAAPGPAAGPVAPAPTPAAPPPDPSAPPMPNQPAEDPAVVQQKVDKALLDLDQTDPEKLYPAITVVQKYKAMQAVPKLVKLLVPEPHADFFTRQAATAALGEMRACDAIPALADTLLDKAMMVAQQANKSIRLITEYDTQMSPQARKIERTKARADVLEWWGRHEEEVRARLKQPKAAK